MPMKILISGGGTGGHIFPALSIANAVKRRYPDAQILFVGALGRMEMERVPAAGYEIIGLPVAGFDRRRLWRNFAAGRSILPGQATTISATSPIPACAAMPHAVASACSTAPAR